MATYQDSSGNNTLVGSPELNPDLTAGKTQVSSGDNLSAPPVSTTFDANSIQNSNSLQLQPTPAPSTTGISNNMSIPSPAIPTAESIVGQNAQNTPAQTQQNTILQRIASLVGGGQTQTTFTNSAESQAGVPSLTKTVNDLNTQLQGLNDQATGLQNEAQYTIPNQAQVDATGRGVTAGGIAPITASQLRVNQIKQGAIATQALTVKAALYGAQGNLTLAKDAADKAATAQYEQQQQQIDYQKAQLDALTPTLNKDEKNQAAIVQAQLADRQTAINNAMDDKKTIIAMATTALKNNPNDPAAQYAAQQALAESNKQQPSLQAALALVGQYQTDPIATQKAIADLQLTRAQTAKTYSDLQSASLSSVNSWATNIKSGTAKLSDVPASLKSAVSTALAQGTSAPSTILATTQASLKELNDMVSSNDGFSSAVGFRGIVGTFTGPIAGTPAADFAAKAKQVVNDVVLPNLTLLHGLGRVTDREFQALQCSITSLSVDPKTGTSPLSEGAFKTELKNITDRINTIASDTSTNSQSDTVNVTSPDGTSGTIPKDQLQAALKAGYKQQ